MMKSDSDNLPKNTMDELQWLTESSYREGTSLERFINKMTDSPLIPLGLLLTLYSFGSILIKKRDREKSMMYMKLRIGFQAFTVAALLGGIFTQLQKNKKKD